MKEEKKQLRILCFTDYTPYGDAAVSHAFALCMIFQAELCIFPLNKEQTFYSNVFNNVLELANQRNITLAHYPDCPKLGKKIYEFIEENNVMMMVISVSKKRKNTFFTYRKALSFIKKSRVPACCRQNTSVGKCI